MWYSDLTESESRRKVLPNYGQDVAWVASYFENKINLNRPSYDINAAGGRFLQTANRSMTYPVRCLTPDSIL